MTTEFVELTEVYRPRKMSRWSVRIDETKAPVLTRKSVNLGNVNSISDHYEGKGSILHFNGHSKGDASRLEVSEARTDIQTPEGFVELTEVHMPLKARGRSLQTDPYGEPSFSPRTVNLNNVSKISEHYSGTGSIIHFNSASTGNDSQIHVRETRDEINAIAKGTASEPAMPF